MSILSFENSYMWKWMSKVRCVSKNQDKHLNSAVYFIFKEHFCCCNLLTCYWISAEYKPKAAACLTTPCLLLIHIFTLKSWSYWDQQKRNRLFFIWDRTLQQWEQMNRNIIRMKPEPINNHKQSSFLFTCKNYQTETLLFCCWDQILCRSLEPEQPINTWSEQSDQ